MALTDHIAILTHHSLAAATPNKLKVGNPLEFYGLIAFPPEAGADLQAIAEVAANGAPLANFAIGINRNNTSKAIPGIPADWFIVRGATQFAPYVANAAGLQLEQTDPASAVIIKSTFYAGKKVRVALTGFTWVFKGKNGISFNLSGVMDAGEQSERLAIGGGDVVNAFQKHANPNAAPAAAGNAFSAPAEQPPVAATPPASANPFAQATPAAGANPFV
jgi:hypothetical protein